MLFTSCAFAEANGTAGYLTDEPVTLTVMKFAHGLEKVSSPADLINVKYLCDTTNIKLDFITITDGEQMNLAINTNMMPDIFLSCGSETSWDDLGIKGSILPLNDLIDEYCPYIQAIFEEMPEAKKAVTAMDGNIYTLPYIVNTGSSTARNDMIIKNTWLSKLGLEVPETVDEFTDALIAFRDNDMNGNGDPSDEIPFVVQDMWALESSLLPWFGELRSDPANGYFSINKDYQLEKLYETEGYRAFIEYVTMLYKENLMDPDFFTKSPEEMMSNIYDDRAGSVRYWQNPNANDLNNWTWMKPLTSDYQETPLAFGTDMVTGGGWALSSTCKDPVLAMKLADLMFRPWNDTWFGISGLFGNNGVEGLDFIILEDGSNQLTYVDDVPATGEYSNWTWYLGYRGLGGLNFGLLDNRAIRAKIDPDNTWLIGRYAILEYDNSVADRARVLPTSMRFTVEESERLSIIVTDMNLIKDEQLARFITGKDELNDDTWDAFLESLNNTGYDEAYDICLAAYER